MSQRLKESLRIGSLAGILALLAILPVTAQEAGFSQHSPVPKFSLSVEKRDAILNNDGVGTSSNVPDFSVLPRAGAASAPVHISGLPMGGTLIPHSQNIDDDRPNSYLDEYQVNWSPWVNDLATRWHGCLKATEVSLGMQFQSPRAALIQFTCYADGRIDNIVLKQSSGIPVYDRLQILTLLHSEPLAPFPQGTAKHSVTLIQGWESHVKQPGEQEFQPWNFASRYPQEKVSKWVSTQ